MVRKSPLPRIQEVAPDQWGLVTRRQLEDLGVGTTTLERLTKPNGELERLAHGVYRVAAAPLPDHAGLRAAWLQLAPEVPAWKRTADQGVVSHRSAASLAGLGHLPADRHEFTVATRRQTRRRDVRFHVRPLRDDESYPDQGLLVTMHWRVASDLLWDHEDPEAVAQIIVDSLRGSSVFSGTFAVALGPHARRFGLRANDGFALLRWLLELMNDPESGRWLATAREQLDRSVAVAG